MCVSCWSRIYYIQNTFCLQELLSEEKKRGKDAEDSSVAYLDQIEALTHKLTMAESKINQYEKDSAEKGVKVKEKYYAALFMRLLK